MEAVGKLHVVDSTVLPSSHFQQVPSAFRGEQLALHLHCDPMSYNHVIIEVLPLFLCLTCSYYTALSTKNRKSPKVVG